VVLVLASLLVVLVPAFPSLVYVVLVPASLPLYRRTNDEAHA
jgi:hypothetical protein